MLKLDDHGSQVAPQAATPIAPQNPDARRLPVPERHVSVTPIDMRQARFASAMRGFDKTEVTAFLERPRRTTSTRCAKTIVCASRSRRNCGPRYAR